MPIVSPETSLLGFIGAEEGENVYLAPPNGSFPSRSPEFCKSLTGLRKSQLLIFQSHPNSPHLLSAIRPVH